jgi:hypothetical protein
MDRQKRWSAERVIAFGAIAVGLAAGTYGVASAASGSSSSGSSSAGSLNLPVAANTPSAAPRAGRPWGHQRSDERPLTGDALANVKAAALAKVSGGTIVRIETDADGNAAYEAHLVKADGTPATVYVNKQYEVVSVESGMPGPRQAPSSSSGASA